MTEPNIEEIETNKISKWYDYPEDDLPTFEKLFLGIHDKNLSRIRLETLKEYSELSKRQEEVSFLHKLISAINAAADKGEVNLNQHPELKEMLGKAETMGVRLANFNKGIMTDRQRDELIHSVRMVVDDENTLIELHMQKLQNVNYELHESYQWMRAHIRVLEELKKKFNARLDQR